MALSFVHGETSAEATNSVFSSGLLVTPEHVLCAFIVMSQYSPFGQIGRTLTFCKFKNYI